ncbi:MAG TPA: hypothetical protein VFY15_06065, partial [Acidimicrobiia bacterium]|nr:hypothetical protein [Acidimicrobiia bacterium]
MRCLFVVLALTAVACSGPQQSVEGVVVAVDGGLSGVDGFELVTGTGERRVFVPDSTLEQFEDGAPLSHLTEHLRTGVP